MLTLLNKWDILKLEMQPYKIRPRAVIGSQPDFGHVGIKASKNYLWGIHWGIYVIKQNMKIFYVDVILVILPKRCSNKKAHWLWKWRNGKFNSANSFSRFEESFLQMCCSVGGCLFTNKENPPRAGKVLLFLKVKCEVLLNFFVQLLAPASFSPQRHERCVFIQHWKRTMHHISPNVQSI